MVSPRYGTQQVDVSGVNTLNGAMVMVIRDPDTLDARVVVRKGSDQTYRLAADLPPNIIGELKGLGERLDRIEFLLEGLAS